MTHCMTAAQELVEGLLRLVAARGAGAARTASNLVAYSGGVDSSLVAAVVHRVFPATGVACLGISAALSSAQLQQAREVATHIGIPLWECPTSEAEDANYVANKGQSCYYCKTNLYTALNEVAVFASKQRLPEDSMDLKPVLYNGTNADDQLDPTRLGLVAATEFQVVSPLSHLTKNQVREAAKHLGLPNWNAAASPCLRSRLEFGIEATQEHLQRVEQAEAFVRELVDLQVHRNLRVRFLAGNRAAVELDAVELPKALKQTETIQSELLRMGFQDVEVRAFRTGALSGYQAPSQA